MNDTKNGDTNTVEQPCCVSIEELAQEFFEVVRTGTNNSYDSDNRFVFPWNETRQDVKDGFIALAKHVQGRHYHITLD